MCDITQYFGYFVTICDHNGDLIELTYKQFDLLKVYGSASTTSLALVKSDILNSKYAAKPSSTPALSASTADQINSPLATDTVALRTNSGSHGEIITLKYTADHKETDNDEEFIWLYAKNLRTNAYGFILCK